MGRTSRSRSIQGPSPRPSSRSRHARKRGTTHSFGCTTRCFGRPDFDEASLLEIAKGESLDLAQVRLAIGTKRHAAVISADVDLAEDVAANGTPTFLHQRSSRGAEPYLSKTW